LLDSISSFLFFLCSSFFFPLSRFSIHPHPGTILRTEFKDTTVQKV
jgi:hypothetical protein